MPSASKTFMRASSGVQVLRFLGSWFVGTGMISARWSTTSYLLFSGAKVLRTPRWETRFTRTPRHEGESLYGLNLLPRPYAPPGTFGPKVLKRENGWLVSREEIVHLRKEVARRGSPRSPIHEKGRNFENYEGEAP
jgi:hypothetical protein